ncbi:MAG TPA: phage holin family protein [candidate division Zixibacteria bacterium]|nr:phage holin family protein [candidate division Zixibacteria bacterium]
MRGHSISKQFNWRMMLVRILVNALALLVITLLPDIHFVEPTVLRVLFVAMVLGVINAFVKPIVQFLTLRFIFITFGFAVVIINAIMLILLNVIIPGMFAVDSLIWALIAGALMGLVSGFFENLLGLQIPIMPEDFGLQPALAADPSMVFQTKMISEVFGLNEGLAAEVPLAVEVTEPVADHDELQEGEER